MNLDMGSLGPTIVGGVAAIFVVFAAGVEAESVTTARGAAEILDAVSYSEIFILGIAAGAAGEVVFRSLATGSRIPRSALAAVTAGAEAARDAAPGTQEQKTAVEKQALGAAFEILQPELDPEKKESDEDGEPAE